MLTRTKLIRSQKASRRGIAVTELAVGLPVLLLIMMGTVETCTMIRLQQKLKIVAYEGARVAVLPEAETVNVTWQCETLCTDQRIQNATFVLSPSDPASLAPGDWMTVEVRAPFSTNALIGGWGFSSYQLSETVTLQKP